MRKYDVSTEEGIDAVRELVRMAGDGAPSVLMQLGADAPDVISQLLEELEAEKMKHHGELGFQVREALKGHLVRKHANRVALTGGVSVQTLSVHLLPEGRVVIDCRLEVDP